MRILVAYDGTEGAQQALAVANELATAAGGALVICCVLNPLVDAAHIVAPTTAEAMDQLEVKVGVAIDEALESLDVTATVRIESVARGEDIAERIARIAAEERATLVAIASQRAVGLRGKLMGSVAQEVLRLSPSPVLVVRPADPVADA
jgi:nucleotide-binding universal stress UspA family protein